MSTPPRSISNRLQPQYVLAGVMLTVIVVAGLLVLALRLAYRDQALPGTEVAGVSLGGASTTEARKRLSPVAGSDVPVVVRAAGKTYRIEPSLLGYEVDVDSTVENALAAGRDGPLGGVLATVTGVVKTRKVPLVTRVDRKRFDKTVASLVDEIDRKPFSGGIKVRTEPIAVESVAPRTGRTADPEAGQPAARTGDSPPAHQRRHDPGHLQARRLPPGGRGRRPGRRELPAEAAVAHRGRQGARGES